MAIEIERKFIVADSSWRKSAKQGRLLRQGYLSAGSNANVRVRITDETSATLTVKLTKSGLSRFEFEQEIPLREGLTLMELCDGAEVQKARYELEWAGLTWEVDDYQGKNHGLIVAEIELRHEDQQIEFPPWLGSEITGIGRYQNSQLAVLPYQAWANRSEPLEAVGT